MSEGLVSLGRSYCAAMESYLSSGGEDALSEAYEIGRRALSAGFGILDMVAIHQDALEANVLLAPAGDRKRCALGAGEFCRELLSPFEMGLRGYRQTNDDLQRLNQALVVQKRKLELANQELESFSYSVSHDLRAPLRSIDGFSQALLEDAADQLDDDAKKYLGYVRDSTRQMSDLIDGLLELARVSRKEVVRSRVDLSDAARRAAARLASLEPERNVELVVADGCVVDGDARLLDVVLQNLIGNAWKFTAKRERARIEFGRRQEDERTVYYVADNGAGFDMEYAGKLFGVFQRLHHQRDFEGTGIGLANVQRIVRRLGGEAWATGEVGKGATFYFTVDGKRK